MHVFIIKITIVIAWLLYLIVITALIFNYYLELLSYNQCSIKWNDSTKSLINATSEMFHEQKAIQYLVKNSLQQVCINWAKK